MRKNFGAKPILYPMPVLMIGTYNEDGTPNAMNAAWGGISEENEITICVDSEHQTAANLLARRAFTVSPGTADTLVACDYLGIVSGKEVPNKVERSGLHAIRAGHVDAPCFCELPMALECRVISYDPESCRLIGEIINVCAEENILDENGKIDPAKLQPICYDSVNHAYLTLGRKIGRAFHDGTALR